MWDRLGISILGIGVLLAASLLGQMSPSLATGIVGIITVYLTNHAISIHLANMADANPYGGYSMNPYQQPQIPVDPNQSEIGGTAR